MDTKKDMGNRMAQIVYEGKWFTPLREAVQAFVESTQKYVTGEVKFKLIKETSSKPVLLLHTPYTVSLWQALQPVTFTIITMQMDSLHYSVCR